MKFEVTKNKLGYEIKYEKFQNVISYGPGENETIIEVHTVQTFESNLGTLFEKLAKELIDEVEDIQK